MRKCSWENFQFHSIEAKCYVTSFLLRFLAEISQSYRFQRFLVRIRSKILPANVLAKLWCVLTSKSTYYIDCLGKFFLKETSV